MKLAELSVRRPVFVTCIFFLILALGALAINRLRVALYPDVSFPVVNVIVPFPGAGPVEIESQISKPIETSLSSIEGIRTVRSLSLDGAGIVTAVFAMNTDLRSSEQKVTQTVARMRSGLPNGIMEPIIRSVDPTETPIVTLTMSADLPEAQLFDLADREIKPMLEQVTDVGDVELQGARKREIQVNLDLKRLRAHEMSAEEVVGRLKATGMNIPAGEVENEDREVLVRVLGAFDSLDSLLKAPIRFVGNEAATSLNQIANVVDGLGDEKNRAYINGKRALIFKVFRRSGANAIRVSEGVKEQALEINQNMKAKVKGFQLNVIRDGAKPIHDGVQDATEAILLGIALTVGVVLLFLGSVKSTIITSLALPNSLLGAFLFMWMAGFSINITTLAALALAVGLLIDDAIVVRENIFRHIEEGQPPRTAAIFGTQEVALAVIATTFTVLSVFGPVSFLSGIIGQFFKEFGLTICFAMMISLLDSLTIAPMLSAYFAGDRHHNGSEGSGGIFSRAFHKVLKPFNRFQDAQARYYEKVLRKSLKYPLRVLLIAVGIFGLSFVVLSMIPKSFVPSQESGEFQVVLNLPAGVSLDAMDQVASSIDKKIQAMPEVASTVRTVGGDVGEKNRAEIVVRLKPSNERKKSTAEMKETVRHELAGMPNLTSSVEDLLDIGGGAGRPFVVHITGENLDELKAVTADIVEKFKKNGNVLDVDRSYRPGSTELRWTVDPVRSRELGVSSAEAGYELRLLLAGETPAKFHENGNEYDIRVRLDPDHRNIAENASEIMIPNIDHHLVPLTSIAHSTLAESPAKIERENRKRFIEISADVNPKGRGLSAVIDDFKRLFDSGEIKHSPGIRYEFAGQTRDFQELLNSVLITVILSVGAMYLVLASLYESFFVPLSIMLVLPLAVCGAFYALFITRSSLDIYSMIGCVLLMGVAAKNSILLVDHIQEGLREGKSLADSILESGRVRLRPIMMTSFALIAGMLPMALAFDEAARQRAPMAIAVIGGVITSTLLTLVVVPAAYEYMLRGEAWVLKIFKKYLKLATYQD
ncbi:MAG: efflux RND transporter permease subunit [Bdellovibrionia bacterium]